jgi:hypothetical protein
MSVMMSPWILKIIYGIIVDSKIVNKRKSYLVSFGLLCTICQVVVITVPFRSSNSVVMMMFLYNLGAAFLDAVIDSFSVE